MESSIQSPTTSQLPANQTDGDAKVVMRAFPNEQAVKSFATALISENDRRATVNARISSKIDSERPHDPQALKQAGLAWKSNFSTRPLNTLVSRVSGRFPRAVASARYLTTSALPDEIQGSREKTEFARTEITKFIRADPRFSTFVEQVSLENCLFGYVCAGWLDETDWFPGFWRQDSFFAPDGCSQDSVESNAVVLRQELTPTAAYQRLEAAEEVKDDRWDRDKLADAINRASGDMNRSPGLAEYARKFADLTRNLSQSSTFTGGKRVVFYHVLGQELDGRVSHYILDDNKNQLFKHEDRFANMADTLVFFTFEAANGKLHGSKGIGRIAYSMAGIIDRSRNDAVDRLQMSGKMVVTGPSANLDRFKLNVVGNTILIGSEFTPSKIQLEADPKSSILLDQQLTRWLDDMTGNVSPQQFDRERVTQEEIKFFAGRDNEKTDDALQRWLRQLGAVITGLQNRLLAPENKDPKVAKLIQRLRTRLSAEEIALFRECPALSTVAALTEQERMSIVQVAMEGRGNPLYNQRELEKSKVSAQVSEEYAAQVLLDDPDPTIAAEQTREQMFENDLLLNGQQVPVSPRDAHDVHLGVMLPTLEHALQQAASDPNAEHLSEILVAHGNEHVIYGEQAGLQSPIIAQAKQVLQQVTAGLQQIKQAAAQAQSEAQVDPATGQPFPPDEAEPAPTTAPLAQDPNAPAPTAPGAPVV